MRPTQTPDPASPQDGAALWRQAQQAFASNQPAERLDALALAAYLDNRLDEAARDQVEGQLALDAAALELCLASDAALGATQMLPASLLARASRLVPGDAPPARLGFIGRLFGGSDRSGGFRLKPGLLAASLAAILVVSVAGFELGRYGYAVAEETYFPETDSLAQAANTAF